jgi:hypothetical protein
VSVSVYNLCTVYIFMVYIIVYIYGILQFILIYVELFVIHSLVDLIFYSF